MQVTYTITCEPEETAILRGSFASGNDARDREIEADIIARYNEGNDWAWCCVKVTASIELDGERFEGCNYLGCSSYESQADFERGGYFEDMKALALDQLKRTLEASRDRGNAASIIKFYLQDV